MTRPDRVRRLVTFLACIGWALPSWAGEIAFTFDDAPRPGSQLMTGEQRTEALIEKLAAGGIEGAIFFSTAGHIDEAGHQRLLRYQQAGHYIANHSYSHTHPHVLGLEAYIEDMQRADQVLSRYERFIPLYRFPFLDEGRDEVTRDGLRAALADLGYQNGYVTVDNYDWYLERLLQKALDEGREVDYENLGRLYVEILADSVGFYDRIAVEALGRSPRHVLLLHENDLAALYVDDLAVELKNRGWTIIPGPDAYQDPIAAKVPDTLFNNQGRVAALANLQGIGRVELIHQAEDEAWLEWLLAEQGFMGDKVAWTPLSSDLVYTSTQTGVSQLFLRSAGAGQVTQLTHAEGGSNYPVWSPDGSRIAFHSRRNGKLDVYVMDADGSNEQRLTDDPAHDYLPSWTPDGQQITFLSWRQEEGDSAEANHVYVMDADGKGQRRLVDESPGTSAGMAWHPAGMRAILTHKTSAAGADLLLVDGAGIEQDRLTDDGRYNGSPDFAPGGQRLAFYSQLDDVSRLEVMGLDGSGRKALSEKGRSWYPRWSPDGCWLVYTRSGSTDDSVLKLWVMRVGSDAYPSILVSGPGNQSEASWRPDAEVDVACD